MMSCKTFSCLFCLKFTNFKSKLKHVCFQNETVKYISFCPTLNIKKKKKAEDKNTVIMLFKMKKQKRYITLY